MNTAHYLETVEQFHVAMLYKQPTPEAPEFDKETIQLRVSLITEEWDELMTATKDDDAIGQLDACCDLQYVISAAALALGFRRYYVAAVSLTGASWGNPFTIGELIPKFASAAFRHNAPGSWGWLAQMESHLHGIIKQLGFTDVFDAAFGEVHRSNMTKQWSELEMATCVEDYDFTRNSAGRYIAYRKDGKIMKPPSYSPAQLQPFIEKAFA